MGKKQQHVVSDDSKAKLPKHPHTLEADEVVKTLGSNVALGLNNDTVKARVAEYGPNEISPPPPPNPWKILGRQLANAMCLVLLASMAVSFGTQDFIEAAVIGALVVLNVVVGFVQEWKAEKTVAALASVGSPTATVVRHDAGSKGQEGKSQNIPSDEVVPGDIIILTNGDVVPADARLLPGYLSNLESDEALLTGESLPIAKKVIALDEEDCPVGDRKNMVFAGSTITKGRARAVVVFTGMATELGKIAEAMERKETNNRKGFAAKWHKLKVYAGVAETTPLQIKLNKLAYTLLGMALVLAFIVVASTGFVTVPDSIATYAVATAVSLLPASLVAVVTMSLASASRDLANKNAVCRRMDAIEALSIVTDICSDKTGTITVGKMVLKKAWVPMKGVSIAPGTDTPTSGKADTSTGQAYEVESGSDPFYPRGVVKSIVPDSPTDSSNETLPTPDNDSDDDITSEAVIQLDEIPGPLLDMVHCASLCNMATLHKGESDAWEANGDATEIALQVFANKMGHGKGHLTHAHRSHKTADAHIPKAKVEGHYEILVEHPFDSNVKRMSTAYAHFPSPGAEADEILIHMKGAVERVLDRCSHIGIGQVAKLEASNKEEIISKMDELAGEGLRVLALAAKRVPTTEKDSIAAVPRDDLENGFCFLGLVGIYDPPRPQSRGAVMECKAAGLIPHMLTGDHPATARAISLAVGILDNQSPESAVMTGQQFDALSEDQIDALPELPLVIARCAPETKVRMVEAIHRRKAHGMWRKTIMTGDGVNDCPSLKRADIGFAMGLNGSDVAKGAADIVLADDNFATITRACKKGRGILKNLSKFLLYLLSGNIAEVLVLVIGLAFKNAENVSIYPISPVAALYINTIAAGPPALALGLEPTAFDAMTHSPAEYRTIFTLEWWADLFFYGILMGALTIGNFAIVVYAAAFNGKTVGLTCNDGNYDRADCANAFHGRATAFATLIVILMAHSLECKHAERGIFQMNLLDNKVLLWSAGICVLTVFPIIYIPTLNDYVFQLDGIGWEWGPVAAALLIYLFFTEMWKLGRRMIYKRRDPNRGKTEDKFPMSMTMAEKNAKEKW